MESFYDVVIIGSGICASELNKKLGEDFKILTITPVAASESQKFQFKGIKGPFSSEQAEKGDSPNGCGAVEYWGGAITWPSDLNYFKITHDRSWSEFYGFIKRKTLNAEYGLHQNPEKIKKFPPRIFSSEQLIPERHEYLGGARSAVFGATSRILENIPRIRAVIQSIKKTHNYKIVLDIESPNKWARNTITCKYLVFASGPLLNPLLYSMISGEREFPYGNHLSLTSHIVGLSKPVIVKSWSQTYSSNEKAFYTYVLSQFPNDSNYISLRLRPGSQISRKELVRNYFFSRNSTTKDKIYYAWVSLYSLLSKSYISKEFSIDLMVNQEPCTNSRIIIEEADPPCVLAIESHLSNELISRIRKHVEGIDKSLAENVGGNGALYIKFRVDNRDLEISDTYRDAAHWYGTVPVGDSMKWLDKNFEARAFPNLFLIGASGFAQGSVGHPTLLALYTAKRAAHVILDREWQ